MDDRTKKLAFLQVLRAFVDAVKEGGNVGAPAGVMYSAVLGKVTLDQFETIMRALVRGGYVRKQGDLYFHIKDL